MALRRFRTGDTTGSEREIAKQTLTGAAHWVRCH
jgi:hypothetical protein